MRSLFLVRHGQGQHEVGDRTGGWSDVALTEFGCRQAHLTGRRLAKLLHKHMLHADGGVTPLTFLCSDLRRAAQTASIVAQELAHEGISLRPIPRAGLRELNNGEAAHMTKEEAAAIAIPVSEPVLEWRPYPGAENWREMVARVAAEMEELNRLVRGTGIIVSHGGSGQAIILWWLRLHELALNSASFQLDTCSITQMGINHWGEGVLIKLNDTSHLEAVS